MYNSSKNWTPLMYAVLLVAFVGATTPSVAGWWPWGWGASDEDKTAETTPTTPNSSNAKSVDQRLQDQVRGLKLKSLQERGFDYTVRTFKAESVRRTQR
ncbi:MAG: hypothetical protein IPK68_20310 [Bdellovibrionales bacterium]|nr:hypothetical protein [Bdellovibrionales bacterium]